MGRDEPLVSVITPVYNREGLVRDAVESVLAQTYENFELIVVDDGSTDETPRILADYAAREPRIQIIRQPNSGRPGRARNRGLEIARGQLLSFLDSDDTYKPERLRTLVDVMATYPEANFCFHDLEVEDVETGKTESYLHESRFPDIAADYLDHVKEDAYLTRPTFFAFMSLNYMAMHVNSALIRASAPVENGLLFHDQYVYGEDSDLWVRLAMANRAVYLDRMLASYRKHDDNVTNDGLAYAEGAAAFHRDNYRRVCGMLDAAQRSEYQAKLARYYRLLGYRCRVSGHRAMSARSYLASSRYELSTEALLGVAKAFLPSSFVGHRRPES